MGHRNIAVNNISIGVKSGEVRGIHRVRFSLKNEKTFQERERFQNKESGVSEKLNA